MLELTDMLSALDYGGAMYEVDELGAEEHPEHFIVIGVYSTISWETEGIYAKTIIEVEHKS